MFGNGPRVGRTCRGYTSRRVQAQGPIGGLVKQARGRSGIATNEVVYVFVHCDDPVFPGR